MNLPLSRLKTLGACGMRDRFATFTAHHGRAPGEDATVAEWLAVTPALADRLWVVRQVLLPAFPEQEAEITRTCQETALLCAAAALPIWEAAYPDDARPRRAVEAARAYLANPSDATCQETTEAAADAAAAYAIAAAVDAAYAIAVDAAYAAAWAADFASRTVADLTTAGARLDELFHNLGVMETP